MSADPNREAYTRLTAAEPVQVAVKPAIDVVPRMTPNTIPTSGPPMHWPEFVGGQRNAIVGGALYEGLAQTETEAVEKLDTAEITVSSCHEHDCIGSVAADAGDSRWGPPIPGATSGVTLRLGFTRRLQLGAKPI